MRRQITVTVEQLILGITAAIAALGLVRSVILEHRLDRLEADDEDDDLDDLDDFLAEEDDDDLLV